VLQQVAERADAQLVLQGTGPHLAHSGHVLDVVVERILHNTKVKQFRIQNSEFKIIFRRGLGKVERSSACGVKNADLSAMYGQSISESRPRYRP